MLFSHLATETSSGVADCAQRELLTPWLETATGYFALRSTWL